MIQPSAFRFASYQAASFHTNVQISTARLLAHLLQALGDVTDGDPIVLPIPEHAPPEVPRVILVSADQAIRVEVSLSRTDVRWQRLASHTTMAPDDFIKLALRAFAAFNDSVRGASNRLALVLQRYQPSGDPGLALARHFCRPELLSQDPKGPLNRPENFELHAHKIYELAGFRVNSWVRCKTGNLVVADEGQRILFVEQDLNTATDALAPKDYPANETARFFETAMQEANSILAVYFPSGVPMRVDQ